jgi:hypothetical protein
MAHVARAIVLVASGVAGCIVGGVVGAVGAVVVAEVLFGRR